MNNNLRILIGTVVAVIVLTVPLFLLPVDGMLITAYLFALAGVFALAGTLFWGCNRSSGEYVTTAAFPLAAAGYLFLNLLVSVLFITLKVREVYAFPAGWFFFLHVLLAGLFTWKLLAMDAGKEQIEAGGDRVQQKTSLWRQLRQNASALAAADPEVKKEIDAVQDAFRYSDPVSSEQLAEIEGRIKTLLEQLSDRIRNHQNNGIPDLCRQLLTEIKIRNERSKTIK